MAVVVVDSGVGVGEQYKRISCSQFFWFFLSLTIQCLTWRQPK